ncbi:MAG TPA: sulfite exporter TauE/SafE family protein [Patescibacteria group bacterium]|nr:sulfite exporter TauE/SafE family protein [Patescibacteria group bacterium]
MHTPLHDPALIFLASVVGGVMNAVAGGGTLVAFPALLFTGVPSIVANATTSLGLWPSAATSGWVYRKHIRASRSTVLLLVAVSIAGGLVGALLLLHTRERVFDRLIPLLLLFATVLFTASGWVRQMTSRMSIPAGRLTVMAIAGQFVIAIYGGYFGAAMGVLMLGLFSLTLHPDMHSMNGLRAVCGSTVNAIAVVVFILGNRIDFHIAALMAVGAILGALAGAFSVRRLQPALARRVVLVIAWTMTVAYIVKMGL